MEIPLKHKSLILTLLIVPMGASAKAKDNGRPRCATVYTVVLQDALGNVRQGLHNPKNVKWADGKLEKKYPDVCYVPPDQKVKTVFVITVTPATYHGARVETSTATHDDPTSGTITGNGGDVGTYEGTQTTTSTSSTAVPYSFAYGRYMLTVETFGDDGKLVVRRRFERDGIDHPRFTFGSPRHYPVNPTKTLIEDAVKWIHAGGLEDPSQSVR